MLKLNHIKSAYIYLLVLFVSINSNACFGKLQPTRDVGFNPISIDNDENFASYSGAATKDFQSSKSATLKGGITKLKSTVGKSQLIRFDEPIKRVSIAEPAMADVILVSPQEMLLNGKASGNTTLVVWGEQGDPVFFEVQVKNDTAAFITSLNALAPDENIDIKFSGAENVVISGHISSTILKGQIKNLAEAYGLKLVDLTESSTPQVMLEVKVAEASRAFTKGFNSEFAHDKNPNSFAGKHSYSYGEDLDDAPASAWANWKSIHTVDMNNGGGGIRYLPFFPKQGILAYFEAAEEKGIVRILAEPKLVATNGNPANFNAGKQIPVPSQIDQNGQLTFEYKDVGINVEFTPIIQEKANTVTLKVKPEVSEIDTTTAMSANGITIFALNSRKAETTVELQDGQTFVIAGLLQRNDTVKKDQVPIMGDLPVIGKLFSSESFKKGETELLIFVTPKIIKNNSIGSNI